ncbi:MAG: hypothetical protein QW594_02040 [Candidatus Woesearchaeota archaeon]
MSRQMSKELDDYLSRKRDDSERFRELIDYAQKKESTKKTNPAKDEEVMLVKEKSNVEYYLDKKIGKLKKGEKETIDLEEISTQDLKQVNEKPEGFFANLKNKIKEFFSPAKEEIPEGDEDIAQLTPQEQVREDMKVVALFTKNLINRLSRREAELLKNDPQFKQFKEIMIKYNVIKKE